MALYWRECYIWSFYLKTLERACDFEKDHWAHISKVLRKSWQQKNLRPDYIRDQIRWISNFGHWLKENRVSINELDTKHAAEYLVFRKQTGKARSGDLAVSQRVLKFLGVQNNASPMVSSTCLISELLKEYELYLFGERSLASSTVRKYRDFTKLFLNHVFANEVPNLSLINGTDVVDFVTDMALRMKSKEAQYLCTSLRSFFQFTRYRGYTTNDLVLTVPKVANRSRTSIPKYLQAEIVEIVLANVDRQSDSGKRDYAILLLLARLGLRAGEIVSLTLDDFDWQQGCIRVRGKGNRWFQLPLPKDVGEAVTAYLLNARPKTKSRAVFFTAKAPRIAIRTQLTIGHIVKRAISRTGIRTSSNGAHQFRHSLATQMLSRGASLNEIGDILRHQRVETTEIYAKVHLVALRMIAQPWPGGAQ